MPFSITGDGRSLSSFFNTPEQNNESLSIDKQNLLCVFKLVIKDLLNSSLRHERLLEKEFFPLKHFLIVFEHILFHGYTGRKSFPISSLSNRKDLWPLIELIGKKSGDNEVVQISVSSKEMPHIRTALGRVRAWLRLALMQKRLGDYFKILIEQKQDLKELYENDAFLLSDEISIVAGLLVGLNVLDLNFCLKEVSLDYPIETSIYYNLYLRERRIPMSALINSVHPTAMVDDQIDELDDYSSLSSSPSAKNLVTNGEPVLMMSTDESTSLDDQRITNIIDQKNYVEELYRNLKKSVHSLETRLREAENKNKTLEQDAIIQKFRSEQFEEEMKKLKIEKEQIEQFHRTKVESLNIDMALERETFQKSRQAFDSMYKELQRKYQEEIHSKEDVESEYQLQLAQKNDFIEATKFMEKDVEIKTTLYNSMKEQIDDVKLENIRLSQRLKVETDRNDELEHQLQSLEKENQMLRSTIGQLENNIEEINRQKHALDETNSSLSRDLSKIDAEKTLIEEKFRIENENRQNIEENFKAEREKLRVAQIEIHDFKIRVQDLERCKAESKRQHDELHKKFQEQEETIRELALKLEISIKREDEFREKDGLRNSTWMKDEDVKDCCQCKKEFSSLRRKHHCRNCGQIFCESCAGTKLPLASSNKPVRVCDVCRNRLLAQCAVNNS